MWVRMHTSGSFIAPSAISARVQEIDMLFSAVVSTTTATHVMPHLHISFPKLRTRMPCVNSRADFAGRRVAAVYVRQLLARARGRQPMRWFFGTAVGG
ncbi:hypothetical protein M3J09_013130 [Ascochyta lentis]